MSMQWRARDGISVESYDSINPEKQLQAYAGSCIVRVRRTGDDWHITTGASGCSQLDRPNYASDLDGQVGRVKSVSCFTMLTKVDMQFLLVRHVLTVFCVMSVNLISCMRLYEMA